MRKKIAFLFPGQGAQYPRMGEQLYAQEAVFRDCIDHADAMVRDRLGASLVEALYGRRPGKPEPFDRTRLTHPALFAFEYAIARMLLERGVEPDAVCGTSLGEITAAVISGALPFDSALAAVCDQAELIAELCEPGAMLAVLGEVGALREYSSLAGGFEVAAVNHSAHVVLATPATRTNELVAALSERNLVHALLPVMHAFHSRWVDAAAEPFRARTATLRINAPERQLVSCVNGQTVSERNPLLPWAAVREQIRFPEALATLEREGPFLYIDCGPAGNLASLTRLLLSTGSSSETAAVLVPYASENATANVTELCERARSVATLSPQRKKVMRSFLFPGQGSQQKGMGEGLFEQYPEITKQADALLGYSIEELCLRDDEGRLNQTQYTQPALFVVNALCFLHKTRTQGLRPDFVAGHSLGEYNALLAAEVIDFASGLRLVQRRGELMARAKGGGMAAVVGLGAQQIRDVLAQNGLATLELANLNSSRQIVLSGPHADVLAAKPLFEAAGARAYVPLNVSGAFHSRYMSGAREEFLHFLGQVRFGAPKIPVISNVTGRPHDGPASTQRLLAEQIDHPVRWSDGILHLLDLGCSEFVEVGPGTVLTALAAKIRREREPVEAASDRPSSPSPAPARKNGHSASSLGSEAFKRAYGVKYAYASGAMYRGIASKELVVRMGKAGMIGFLGTGGLSNAEIAAGIDFIQAALGRDGTYGMNLLHNPLSATAEDETVDLFIDRGIRHVEAAAYMGMTPALVRYRLCGLGAAPGGGARIHHTVMAKVSRPEVALNFLSPAPERMVTKLLEERKITREQAELAARVPMADDICVEADSGGHTDQGVMFSLLPAMMALRDEVSARFAYAQRIRVGAAGGIGTPQAAAAAFLMGAEFVLTGSINQCTVEAGTSDLVKDMLQDINVQDTDYAPAGDMFEMGAKVQVLRRGVFFPARANRLYDLYRQYDSIDDIDDKTRTQVQDKYFRRSFAEVWQDTRRYFERADPSQLEKAEKMPKHKMALIFRWYFGASTRFAMAGDAERKVDFQVHCGPALGSFNQWVKGTPLASWRNRHADDIGQRLMEGAAAVLNTFGSQAH